VSDFNYDIGPTVKAAAAAGRKSSLYYPPNVVNNGLGAHLEHRKADHLEHQIP
jgi:predicted small lipoprotein YifL